MRKKVAIFLFGAGVFDGSEIVESVSCQIAAERAGASVEFFSPDVFQRDVVDHASGKASNERRNVKSESARIARGKIFDAKDFNAEDFDALIFPGGFGAAKNASDFALKGKNAKVLPEIERAVLDFFALKKPMGFACISPASIAAPVLGKFGVSLTIGSDAQTAQILESFGAKHVGCAAKSFVKDEARPVFSTPAYMLAANAAEVFEGISKMVSAMLK